MAGKDAVVVKTVKYKMADPKRLQKVTDELVIKFLWVCSTRRNEYISKVDDSGALQAFTPPV